MKHNVRFL